MSLVHNCFQTGNLAGRKPEFLRKEKTCLLPAFAEKNEIDTSCHWRKKSQSESLRSRLFPDEIPAQEGAPAESQKGRALRAKKVEVSLRLQVEQVRWRAKYQMEQLIAETKGLYVGSPPRTPERQAALSCLRELLGRNSP